MINNPLVPNINSKVRVAKYEVFFDLFKIKTKNVSWYATEHENLGLFYGGDIDNYSIVIKDIVRQSLQKANSMNLISFDRDISYLMHQSIVDSPSKKNNFLKLINIKDDLSFVDRVASLIDFRQEIESMSRQSQMVEPANKKMDIILLHLSDSDVSTLHQNSNVANDFKNLLQDSRKQRLSLFVMYKDITKFPIEIIKSMDWVASLASDAAFARSNVFTHLNDTTYDIDQVVIGNLCRKGVSELDIIHPRRFTESDWRIAEDKRIEIEKLTYEKYLNSLDDGS